MTDTQTQTQEGKIDPMKCWASCIDGCSNKISREHTVTRAMFLDKEITVSGPPWCARVPKNIGLANLTAKVLCVVHNSALSEVDQEAVRFAEAMRESFRLLTVRHNLKPRRWTIKRFPVDGQRMERWFLKTLINVACHRGSPIGPDSHHRGLPSNSLVEIAFGRRTFEPNAGLYGVYDAPEKRPHMDGILIHAVNTTENRVVGAVFSFLGFRLLLFLDRKGPPPLMEVGTATGETTERIEPCYHPKGIDYLAGKATSHTLEFKWHS
jgi:hypothetical protein